MMIMMATDFSGENAETWYRNIDKLIHYVNLPGGPGGGGKYNLLYSTPSIYTAAKAATTPLPLRDEDVMPYADGPHAFWSGYFSSRAALKGYVRDSSQVFQAAKQMQALTGGVANVDDPASNPLYLLERAMGVTQHHDAVSGTSKQHVANDYARRLARGRLAADAAISSALSVLSGVGGLTYESCDLANVTICPALESASNTVALTVWNQLSADSDARVRVPVNKASTWSVISSDGSTVLPSQLTPVSDVDTHLRADYYNYTGPDVQWLSFTVPVVPAVGFSTVFLIPGGAPAAPPSVDARGAAAPNTVISNGLVNLTFDGTTGLLTTIATRSLGWQPRTFSQTFKYYNSSTGNTIDDHSSDSSQSSGAYIFRPNSSMTYDVAAGPPAVVVIATGPVVWEVQQTFANWATQRVRLWSNSEEVEFEFTIGPIPANGALNPDGEGREVISLYTSDIVSNKTWTSDSNGRDTITRVRDFRRSWSYHVIEPVAGNFVPVNLFTALSDATAALSVVTDRTQAGSSMVDGSLELMVHRRLQNDDSRGVGEPLNETGLDGNGLIVRGVHRVRLSAPASAGKDLRETAASSLFRPLYSFANLGAGANVPAWVATANTHFGGLAAPLAPNLHVVTAQSLAPGTLLVRIAHMFAVGEDAVLSLPATVGLADLFTGLKVTGATEMTLPGTIPLTLAPTTTFTTRGDNKTITLPVIPDAPSGDQLLITLSAMQIRTFKCTVVNV